MSLAIDLRDGRIVLELTLTAVAASVSTSVGIATVSALCTVTVVLSVVVPIGASSIVVPAAIIATVPVGRT